MTPTRRSRNGQTKTNGAASQRLETARAEVRSRVPRIKRFDELDLKDRLSHLTLDGAKKLLGSNATKLIMAGAKLDLSPKDHVYLGKDLFRLTVPSEGRRPAAIVTITLMASALDRLHMRCTRCSQPCEHLGAALSMILEEKTALGLAVAPEAPDISQNPASEEEQIAVALAEREERARAEQMKIQSSDRSIPWTDYTVTSTLSGKTYRVALRGPKPGDSYCSCPDFRTNTLGTCKHILHTLGKVRRRLGAELLAMPYLQKSICIALRYDRELELRILLPSKLDDEANSIIGKLRDQPIDDLHDLLKRVRHLERSRHEVTIYPDAEEFIQQRLFQDKISERIAEIRRSPKSHPLRTELLKTELLPYQLDGIAFAVGAGRAILADEMGLGKTIQGIGVAELFARETDIKKVLVVTPASLKSQWRNEIERFSGRNVQLIGGSSSERSTQYANEAFFTICNYEQVLRDILNIERVDWDLIVLDEGQRIKNWESKTTRMVKGLRSRFALVLTGTPLENRLDDLYSVVQFIDDRRLGPGFRFFHRHRVVDERGKVLGYRNLTDLRQTLAPILLRRTRASVKQQLPPRTDEIVRIPPTQEQLDMSNGHLQNVSRIVAKKFLTEMDLLALQRELLLCRMTADSTYLVNKEAPGFSSKLERLNELLESLFEEEGRKAVVFSEWTTMLNLIEPLLHKRKLKYVRLDGSVPQKQRQAIVHQFQTEPDCQLFLTTNAGSTGLNLQAANTVINVDLPWNPAVLEQRIARAYRMGQKRPVDVYVLVTEQTLEERLLGTLAAKHELALAALDAESDIDEVHLETGLAELKRRLEVLIGAKPEAIVDESSRRNETESIERNAQSERVSAAGGQLLASAINFLSEMIPARPDTDASRAMAGTIKQGLSDFIQRDEQGQLKLSFAVPDAAILDRLAESLAKLLIK
ncbi:DEAD/DEAH box helicase [Schlesneria paludicola]|uniref:DEAD/DEAH box helicase n=1 Tax=Schlesneria paludicola TaxID=360056 RepID=UPI00029A9613|nr:DEAD/DEAH box helicase [Schlesneria paludicola]